MVDDIQEPMPNVKRQGMADEVTILDNHKNNNVMFRSEQISQTNNFQTSL